jgi:predicted transcriptional regulator
VNLWLNELQNNFNINLNDIIKLTNISKSTYYRILSGKSVSEKTRYKIFKAYLQILNKEKIEKKINL